VSPAITARLELSKARFEPTFFALEQPDAVDEPQMTLTDHIVLPNLRVPGWARPIRPAKPN
jgi:hypothetical protein